MNETEILLNLDVVSQVGINDKLVTQGFTFNIRPNTYTRSFSRWWYDEGRVKDYESLRSLFGSAINLTELLIFRKDIASAARVLAAITPALRGVQNLSQTYRDDVDVHAKFTRLVKDVGEAVCNLQALLAPHFHLHPHDSGSAPPSSSPPLPRMPHTDTSSD